MSKKIFKMASAAAAVAGFLIAAPAFAEPATVPGPGMGPGMMGGGEQECDMGPQMGGGYAQGYVMGAGMMGGSGHGHGMDSGMMGGSGRGHGMGPGMMGGSGHGHGMGPGMMGGSGHDRGMGPGMMGGSGRGHGMDSAMMGGSGRGHGMGQGMMGYGGAPGLDLDDEQRAKARKIHDASRKKMWGAMGGMLDASSNLRELLSDSARDRASISAAYKQVAELRQKMFEIRLDAQEEFEQILTSEQRKQLRR